MGMNLDLCAVTLLGMSAAAAGFGLRPNRWLLHSTLSTGVRSVGTAAAAGGANGLALASSVRPTGGTTPEPPVLRAVEPEPVEEIDEDEIEAFGEDYLRVRLAFEGDALSRIILVDAEDLETEWVRAAGQPVAMAAAAEATDEGADAEYMRIRLVFEGDELSRIMLTESGDLETEWVRADSQPVVIEKSA